MLKLKDLNENFALVKEILAKYWEYDPDGLDEMLSYFRVSSNAIYPYRANGEVCFLRLAPVEEKQAKNILGEMEYIHYLVENHYPALEPIKAKTGETCLTLNTPWGEYYVTSFKRVKGVQIEKTDYAKPIMYAYGKSLGELHTLAAAYMPTIKKWDHTEALAWIGEVLRKYKAPVCAFTELEQVRQALGELPMNADCYGLVHYDFELDNVFYDAETNSCHVIDFDDGMYHWYALDIVQALDCLEEELSGEEYEQAKEEFLKGYRSAHCLTAEMEKSYALMGRFTNLYGYARLIRCIDEKFDVEPDWMTSLRNKLSDVSHAKALKMSR